MSAKEESGETVTSTALKSTEHKQQGKTEDQKSTRHPSKSSKKRPTRAAQKLRKIYADRWVKHLLGMVKAVKFSVYLLKAKIQIPRSPTARVHQCLSGRRVGSLSGRVAVVSFIGRLVLAFACLWMLPDDQQFILNGAIKHTPLIMVAWVKIMPGTNLCSCSGTWSQIPLAGPTGKGRSEPCFWTQSFCRAHRASVAIIAIIEQVMYIKTKDFLSF